MDENPQSQPNQEPGNPNMPQQPDMPQQSNMQGGPTPQQVPPPPPYRQDAYPQGNYPPGNYPGPYSQPPGYPPPTYEQPRPRTGIPVWAWILGGLLVLILLFCAFTFFGLAILGNQVSGQFSTIASGLR